MASGRGNSGCTVVCQPAMREQLDQSLAVQKRRVTSTRAFDNEEHNMEQYGKHLTCRDLRLRPNYAISVQLLLVDG